MLCPYRCVALVAGCFSTTATKLRAPWQTANSGKWFDSILPTAALTLGLSRPTALAPYHSESWSGGTARLCDKGPHRRTVFPGPKQRKMEDSQEKARSHLQARWQLFGNEHYLNMTSQDTDGRTDSTFFLLQFVAPKRRRQQQQQEYASEQPTRDDCPCHFHHIVLDHLCHLGTGHRTWRPC